MGKIKTTKAPKKLRNALSPKEVVEIKNCETLTIRQRAILSIFINTGCRLAEKRSGKPIPDEIKNKETQRVKNHSIIKAQIESKKLTSEQYKGYLQTQLNKDQELLQCLKKLNQKNKAVIVENRIECIKKELSSL